MSKGRPRTADIARGPDPAVVRQLIEGMYPRNSTPPERRLACARLTAKGFDSLSIAARLGITKRTVNRYKNRPAP